MYRMKSKFRAQHLRRRIYRKGEGLRQRLRNPDTIKEYRKQLKALETEILEQMKGFYDQFEGELEGHALTADELKTVHEESAAISVS